MTEDEIAEQESFEDLTRCLGQSYARLAHLTTIPNLNFDQQEAVDAALKPTIALTRSLRQELMRMPVIQPSRSTKPKPDPTGKAIGASQKDNPVRAAVKAASNTVSAIANVVAGPNRLTDEQRELAFDVIDATFALIDTFKNEAWTPTLVRRSPAQPATGATL